MIGPVLSEEGVRVTHESRAKPGKALYKRWGLRNRREDAAMGNADGRVSRD